MNRKVQIIIFCVIIVFLLIMFVGSNFSMRHSKDVKISFDAALEDEDTEASYFNIGAGEIEIFEESERYFDWGDVEDTESGDTYTYNGESTEVAEPVVDGQGEDYGDNDFVEGALDPISDDNITIIVMYYVCGLYLDEGEGYFTEEMLSARDELMKEEPYISIYDADVISTNLLSNNVIVYTLSDGSTWEFQYTLSEDGSKVTSIEYLGG